ncbi:MAG: DUF4403 family protein [Chromatiaceae bacterium]|nr:DUF4403 family protein [Chromatiaceae bacterium]
MRFGQLGRLEWLGFLPVCLLLVSAGIASTAALAVPPLSVIQVPLELDLRPLFEAAEASLPTQAGHWPGWRDWHGIEARYRAWRGPLRLSMQGDLLQAQAHVRYQLQARKRLVGKIGLTAGCGVDEPPRQALIGVLARLDWGPNWSLHPRFRVMPTRFLDRCEVTVADIDLSPLVGQVFEARIATSLMDAMHALTPRLGRLRQEAARAWQDLQTPRELSPGLWLHIRPLQLALVPPQGSGERAHTAVWLAFRAAVSGDRESAIAPTPLPPLVPYRPSQPGLRFELGLSLDYAEVSAALSERLAGQIMDVQGHEIRLEGISLAAGDEDLVITADLTGDLAGRITIMSRPGFDIATQVLRLEQLDFVFDAADPDQALLTDLFYDRIRARIETAANDLLAERTSGFRSGLRRALAQSLPSVLRPELEGLRLVEARILVGEDGISLSGSAEGTLRFDPSGSPGPP